MTWKRSNIWDEDWVVKRQWSPIPSRPPGWYDCISDTWYFFCRKSLFTTKHKILKRQKKKKGKKRQHLKTRSFFTCGKHRLAQNTIYQQAKKENGRNKSLWMYCSPLKPTIILKVLRSGKRVTNERAYFLKYDGTLLKNLGKHWLCRFANFFTDVSFSSVYWCFWLPFPLMFVTHKLQLLKVSEMIVACQKYPQKELVANVLCCDDSVPQSSALIGTKDHSSKINEIKRSITRIKRDQKIKDQAVSRINGSKFIKDQRSTRSKSWRSTGDQVVSDQRSKVQSSTFHRSDH